MTYLHRQILRMLPGPFFGWLGMLMFLLVMQFLIRYLPDIVGKGLPVGVILELIAYNLAYMVVLAVPMSVLIAVLMSFGRLAETNAYMVVKSAGISVTQIMWPTLVVGAALMGLMWKFNNDILPEANFRARNLWIDIQRKRPDFELQPGVFYGGLNGYSILVQRIPAYSSTLEDILIYDYTEGAHRRSDIKARRGWITPAGPDQMNLTLEDGEIHRLMSDYGPNLVERYERIQFDRLRLSLDLSAFQFERSDVTEGYRSDRTMRSAEMIREVDSIRVNVDREQGVLRDRLVKLLQYPPVASSDYRSTADTAVSPDSLYASEDSAAVLTRRSLLAGVPAQERLEMLVSTAERVRSARTGMEDMQRTIEWENARADRQRVEIHKKRSIAAACLIFMLIGAPLGLSIRRGGLGTAAALAIGIFLFYWVTLVQGEKLADRGLLRPWIGMWIANLAMVLFGLWLIVYTTLDLHATPTLRRRLAMWLRKVKSARIV